MDIQAALTKAIENLEAAKDGLKGIIKRGAYTTQQIKDIRRIILNTVRSEIDPIASISERHY